MCVYCVLCVCQHFQTSSPQKPLGQSKSNFIWSLHGIGERKTNMAAMPIYGKKTLKIFFSGTKWPMTLKLGMQHWVLKYYQVSSNDDPGLTLTYFTARSNLVPYVFVWEKGKTMDFSETIVVYDVKVDKCSQRNDYMNLYEYQRSRSFIDLGPRSLRFNIFKFLFLRNCLADWSQILCGASIGWENKSLYNWSKSHDQDGRHAHIW